MSATHGEGYSTTVVPHFKDSEADEVAFFEKRAKVGVLLLIMSDGLMVIAAYLGFLYLYALNTSHAFRPASEQAPAIAGGLIVTLAVVLGAVVFRSQIVPSARSGSDAGVRSGLVLALALACVAFAVQVWSVATGFSFPAPVHGYASMIMLLGAIGLFHTFLTLVISLFLFGRARRGLLTGLTYPLETAGYWWYYIAGLFVVSLLLTALL
ncbi:MAG: hypothetical protein M1115_00085 [Actinobacteria bacterium]|nr:hypothetical protein [Actinomycetota bacterium]